MKRLAEKKILEWKNAEYVMPKLAQRYLSPSSPISAEAATVFKFIGLEINKEVKKGQRRKKKTCVYGFHSFRHSFVSFCAKAGVPMPVVQSIVGHGSPAVTRHYVHIGEGAARQAINALPQGKSTSEKTDRQKFKIISNILNSKTVLTKSDKQILETLSN